MCGIAGLWNAESVSEERALAHVQAMTDTLIHRGPDASGVTSDWGSGIVLGHRRLSILDLGEGGAQPMWSSSGRSCIVYNGEVYNAPELRQELERDGWGVRWRGHSDTEVVVEAIEALGLRRALSRFRGMFAFALWDAERKRLSLVRDRLGIKPLLYVQGRFGMAFASELQALFHVPGFGGRLDCRALAAFLRYGVVPDHECIVEGVRKVSPGTIVELDAPAAPFREVGYWSAVDVARAGIEQPFSGSKDEGVAELASALRESVSMRMRSDVPFGAFLSGGIDSSTVAALMQSVSTKPVDTFCIGSSLAGYDESSHAEAVAAHLGCNHHTLIATPEEVLAVVPDIARHWDEPFADSSQIPTFLVSRLTRAHVTVSLSGDGGDELFAGYNRHAWAPRLWGLSRVAPKGMLRALGALRAIKVEDWDRAFDAIGLGSALRLPGDKLHKVAALAEVGDAHGFYERLRSQWVSPDEALVGGTSAPIVDRGFDAGFAEQMMLYDLVEYLPDDILTKVDRASMAVSLEARVPILDHEIVELAWKLPTRWKIRGRTQKWILRQVLGKYVPESLYERAKMGFGVPVGAWLRGPLQPWAAALLEPSALRSDGIFDTEVVSRTWREHGEGRGNHEHRLWAVLMFQSWWRSNRRYIEA